MKQLPQLASRYDGHLETFLNRKYSKCNQAFLRIFSIETFQSDHPFGRHLRELFRACS